MDLILELELMAANAIELDNMKADIDEQDLERWKKLFKLKTNEAESCIRSYRADLTRERVSDEHWEIIRSQISAQGHDKESYEYSLQHEVPRSQANTPGDSSEYLFKLEGPLLSPADVRRAAGLDHDPKNLPAVDDSDDKTSFVLVDGWAKQAITQQYEQNGFRPVFIRISKAKKSLCTHSAYPTLGIDTSLPQFRLSIGKSTECGVLQDEYPVWYFFYGSLQDPARLERLLQSEEEVHLIKAHVLGGKIRLWAQKYKALVDGDERIEGSAYLVRYQEHEQALQFYETENYEVVRCQIHMEGVTRNGLTFRFANKQNLG